MQQLWVRWPLQPLQALQKTQLQPPFGPSVDSLLPWMRSNNSPLLFLSFKLLPPPCAVLLVYIHARIRVWLHRTKLYIICEYRVYTHAACYIYVEHFAKPMPACCNKGIISVSILDMSWVLDAIEVFWQRFLIPPSQHPWMQSDTHIGRYVLMPAYSQILVFLSYYRRCSSCRCAVLCGALCVPLPLPLGLEQVPPRKWRLWQVLSVGCSQICTFWALLRLQHGIRWYSCVYIVYVVLMHRCKKGRVCFSLDTLQCADAQIALATSWEIRRGLLVLRHVQKILIESCIDTWLQICRQVCKRSATVFVFIITRHSNEKVLLLGHRFFWSIKHIIKIKQIF